MASKIILSGWENLRTFVLWTIEVTGTVREVFLYV